MSSPSHAAVAFNVLVGNSDAHGKNFALLYDSTAGPRLAPLYDIVSEGWHRPVIDQVCAVIERRAARIP